MNFDQVVSAPELVAAVDEEAGKDAVLVKTVFYLINRLADSTGPSRSGFAATAARLRGMDIAAMAAKVIDGKGRVRSLRGQGWGPYVAHVVALAALLEHSDPLRASRRVADEAATKNEVFRAGIWARAKIDAHADGKEEPKLEDIEFKDISNFELLSKRATYFEDNAEKTKEVVNDLLKRIANGVDKEDAPRVQDVGSNLEFEPKYIPEAKRNERERGLRAADAEDDWLV